MPILVDAGADFVEEYGELDTQAWLGDSGIVCNDPAGDAYGCVWTWSGTNAWGGKPEPKEQTGDRPFADGQWDATAFYGARTLAFTGACRAPDHVALHVAEQRLRDAVAISLFTFRVTEPGFDGWCLMRQQGQVLWTELNHRTASYSLGLYAPDPRIWSSAARSFSTGFPSSVGGLVLPVTPPFTIDAVVTSNTASLANPGSVPVPLRTRLDGPAEDAELTVTSGTGAVSNLRLANPDGDLLADSEWLLIDSDTRQVLLGGVSSRRSWAAGTFPVVPPGESTFILSGTGTGSASGSYSSARL